MRTISIRVYGKVQGVFFRKYTVLAAEKNGINGFVTNSEDGSVYIEASANKSAIEKFIAWCHQGSPFSKVEKVVVNELQQTEYAGFVVRY